MMEARPILTREVFSMHNTILKPEAAGLYGHLEISAYDALRGGKRVYHVTKKNQITDYARQVVLEMLTQYPGGSPGQANPEYNQLWSLAVGSDPTPANAAQMDLGAMVLTKVFARPAEVLYVIHPTYEIHCSMTFGIAEANAYLAEVGIFTRGDNDDPYAPGIADRYMYARQTFSPFTKTGTMTVVFNWIFGMTIA